MKSPIPKLANAFAEAVGLARRGDDLERLIGGLSDAQQQREAALRDREAAAEAYRSGLLDASAGELERLLAAQNRAGVEVDKADALIVAFNDRINTVREDRARAARQAIHDDAAAKCEAIRGRLAAEYAHHAGSLRALLRDLSEAEVARERAAKEAPDLPYIESPENILRALGGLPEEIVSVEDALLWTVVGRITPLSPERQEEVRRNPNNPNLGTWTSAGSSTASGASGSVNLDVALVPYKRISYRERVEGFGHEALHRAVALPGFAFTDAPFVRADVLRDHAGALTELSAELPASAPVVRPIRERLEIVSVEQPPAREQVIPYPKREVQPERTPGAREIREAHTPSTIMAAGAKR